MQNIFDVVLYIHAWLGSTYWEFNFAFIDWQIPMLYLVYGFPIGCLLVFTVKKMLDL